MTREKIPHLLWMLFGFGLSYSYFSKEDYLVGIFGICIGISFAYKLINTKKNEIK